MKCPNCQSIKDFEWVSSGVLRCKTCQTEGNWHEFGCVGEMSVYEALRQVDRGLAGEKEARVIRQTLQNYYDLWHSECESFKQSEEELAEARHVARKLYRHNNVELPDWVTWLERQP